MAAEVACRVCDWEGDRDELRRPPTGESLFYCPNCASVVELD